MLAPNKRRLVIIGNGMAGARLVEEVLQRGPLLFDITVIGDESGGSYNRILLSDVLNGQQRSEEIITHRPQWYEENRVRLISGIRAVKIDRRRRRVLLADGNGVNYDKL